MATLHRYWIKQGHKAFGVVLSDDDDDGGGASGITPDSLLSPYAQGGLPHPYLQDKAYFSGVDNRKMSALPTENSAVSQDQFPEPNLSPSLSHSHQAKAAPRKMTTPRPG